MICAVGTDHEYDNSKQALQEIVQRDGWRSLFAGLPFSLFLTACGGSLFFIIKRQFSK
jgi:hypothetical protein